ncbi:hypothetical protein HanIR_Chr15g0762221 [Helianthus annuus]|nr:hypothetical protein HanIR_Chr15g0762221 [Helianthus annuus]
MLPESPPLRDPKAPIEDSAPVLSTNETVLWKRMHENPTRAYNFPEGVLAMGGLSPLYSFRLKAYFGKKFISSVCLLGAEMTLWGLLQGDCRGIKFMVGDVVNPEMGNVLEGKTSGKGNFVYVRGSAATEKGEETPSHEEDSSKEVEGSQGSLLVKDSSGDEDEDLESHLIRKRKADPEFGLKAAIPEPRNICSRLKSASSQKSFPVSKGSSKAPIVIPVAPAFSRVKDKAPETSDAHTIPAIEVSPLRATGTSKLKQPEDLYSRSPLAPLFAEGLTIPYVPKWKITTSTVVWTPETARDFMNHVVPPPHKFMNFTLDPNLFDDQYNMSICKGFFRGGGWHVAEGERAKEHK